MKFALITGGSRGIGRAISLKLADSGYFVVINYKANKSAAEETLNSIKKLGGKGEIAKFDISNKIEIREFYKNWQERYPESYIDVLVNNAGTTADNLMVFMEDIQWEGVVNTNLNSFYYMTKALLSDMIINKHGRIISIVSLSGQKGLAGQTNYSAAKAGVIGSTKSLAQEVGKRM